MKKIPAAFITANATVSDASKKVQAAASKVQARIDMSADVAGAGLCPECHKPMERSHANGFPILTCDEHRIAIPIPDSQV
jgi:cytochrome c553